MRRRLFWSLLFLVSQTMLHGIMTVSTLKATFRQLARDMIRLTAFAVILLAALPIRADAPVDPLAGFDDYANTALADLKTPGLAVAIIKNGKVIFARGYGVRKVGGEERVDENTIFPIASVTKVFTATCLARLVDDGKLKWNDPVAKHLPEFQLHDPNLTRDVSLTDLLAHRTGLERGDLLAYRGDYDRPELLRRLRYLQPLTPFRDRSGYHNLLVVTAGELLERVSGRSWGELVKTQVFQPLGMSRTFLGPSDLMGLTNVSTPHVLKEAKPVPDPAWSRDTPSEGFQRLHTAVAPAGAIQSTVVDMARFLQLCLNDGEFEGRRYLQAATVHEMFAAHSVLPVKPPTDPNFAYPRFLSACGLGWWLRDFRGRKIVYHGGSSGAVAAMMPEERLGVVVLANLGTGVVYMMMHDLFDRLLGLPRTWTNRDWQIEAMEKPDQDAAAKNALLEAQRAKDTRPNLSLDAYTGTYTCDLYGNLEIRRENEFLRLQFGPNMHAALRHWDHDRFRAKLSFPAGDEWFIKFVVADDKADRLEIERIWWHEPMPAFVRVGSRNESK